MDYIERNNQKCFSMPSLIGRRLTVFDVVTQIQGEGLKLTMKDYDISFQQAYAALEYCSQQMCKINSENFQFCDGCVLRTIADGDIFNRDDYYEVMHADGSKSTISKVDGAVYLGSLDELEIEEIGIKTWTIAKALLISLTR